MNPSWVDSWNELINILSAPRTRNNSPSDRPTTSLHHSPATSSRRDCFDACDAHRGGNYACGADRLPRTFPVTCDRPESVAVGRIALQFVVVVPPPGRRAQRREDNEFRIMLLRDCVIGRSDSDDDRKKMSLRRAPHTGIICMIPGPSFRIAFAAKDNTANDRRVFNSTTHCS